MSTTGKGNLGLFGDSLFLSKDIALDGVSSEDLAERLLAFSRLADDIEKQLDSGSDGSGGVEAFSSVRPDDLGDFVHV